jgi:DNA-binding PadR family transcriptional regulator
VPTLTTTGACVLGLLEMGPPPPARRRPGPEAMTGWQIYETASASLARFWNITRSQVYLELGRLEQDGLVASTGAEGPHARRPYTITEAGRTAFREWLRAWAATEPRDEQLRSPLLLTVFFGGMLDPDTLRRTLQEYRLRHERLHADRVAMLAGIEPDHPTAPPTAVLRRAVAYHELTARWIAETLDRLPDDASGT